MNHNSNECESCKNGLKETNKVTDIIGIISLTVIAILYIGGFV